MKTYVCVHTHVCDSIYREHRDKVKHFFKHLYTEGSKTG